MKNRKIFRPRGARPGGYRARRGPLSPLEGPKHPLETPAPSAPRGLLGPLEVPKGPLEALKGRRRRPKILALRALIK